MQLGEKIFDGSKRALVSGLGMRLASIALFKRSPRNCL